MQIKPPTRPAQRQYHSTMDVYAPLRSSAPVKSTARNRRERENVEFEELGKLLPLPSAITCQLDKASIVRLTTSYLHLRNVIPSVMAHGQQLQLFQQMRSYPEMKEISSHLMQTLEGFVFVLSPSGKIMYISETASVHMGMSQVELTGNNIFDYIHPNDRAELNHLLQNNKFDQCADACHQLRCTRIGDAELERSFFVRMKCVLAKRNAGLTDQGYKVVHCSGFLKFKHRSSLEASSDADGCMENLGLVAIGYTMPPTVVTEIRLSPFMFMFRAALDLKIVFLDSRAAELTSYDLQELLDKSLYDLVHVEETMHLKMAHLTLMKKHQVTTHYYRLLVKTGGWVWVQSQLTLIQLPRASRPACILGVTTVVSEQQHGDELLHHIQVPTRREPKVTNYASPFLGAYSEQFYGPDAVMLMHQQNGEPKRSAHHFEDRFTGEKRFCLRDAPPMVEPHSFAGLDRQSVIVSGNSY